MSEVIKNQVIIPPIDAINKRRKELEATGIDIINLGQGIVDFSPPEEILQEVAKEPGLFDYTPDPGLFSLRSEVAKRLGPPCKTEEIVITSGANFAFLLAATTLFNPGDAIGIFSPYYFNHQMVLSSLRLECVEIEPNDSYEYDLDQLEKITEEKKLKAIVLVSPCNPSGKVFGKAELEKIAKVCVKNQIFLLMDEVYKDFVYEDGLADKIPFAHTLEGMGDLAINLGSFSKLYGMMGYRVGWLRMPLKFIDQVIKVQDMSVICACHFSQRVALKILQKNPKFTYDYLPILKDRREKVLDRLEKSGLFEIFPSGGALFIWFRPKNMDVSADQEVFNILEKKHVCIVSGAAFGKAWKSWFRFSFGRCNVDILLEGANRLIEYFSELDK
ncbi:aspartate aminotransferase [Anaeramoeba ignava]|uniref:Aspartate aminotransferase n=1 Tax=Anaeramoeba ignava TaxID=1746090 RepID=A0A9Q0LYK6_ANAIG|nr:aspartate aminotransferase [Anaeramoeba ignava]